jgi:hypothetical protein
MLSTPNLIRSFFAGTFFLFISPGCTHKPDEVPLPSLKIADIALIYEEDSVQMVLLEDGHAVSQPVVWNVSAGAVSLAGMLTAPVIQVDTQRVEVSASYKGQLIKTVLPVTKRAFLAEPVSFSQTVLPLFVSNCNFSGCHGNGSRGGRVELSSYDSVMNAVIPFAAINSKAYYAMVKPDPLRVMPPAGKLHQHKIDAVKHWIDQGALNN